MVSHSQSQPVEWTPKEESGCAPLMDKGFLEVSHMIFARQKRKYMWLETQIHETTEKNEAPETLDTLESPETPEESVSFGSKMTGMYVSLPYRSPLTF